MNEHNPIRGIWPFFSAQMRIKTSLGLSWTCKTKEKGKGGELRLGLSHILWNEKLMCLEKSICVPFSKRVSNDTFTINRPGVRTLMMIVLFTFSIHLRDEIIPVGVYHLFFWRLYIKVKYILLEDKYTTINAGNGAASHILLLILISILIFNPIKSTNLHL